MFTNNQNQIENKDSWAYKILNLSIFSIHLFLWFKQFNTGVGNIYTNINSNLYPFYWVSDSNVVNWIIAFCYLIYIIFGIISLLRTSKLQEKPIDSFLKVYWFSSPILLLVNMSQIFFIFLAFVIKESMPLVILSFMFLNVALFLDIIIVWKNRQRLGFLHFVIIFFLLLIFIFSFIPLK